ncbi:zinc ABC transporter ATP-binding protein AztA [Leifsonia sp. Root4]|uniref:zinc ABC transporter ATP-binding protein AztA n=1 Tax=Leifsonia sp. Root4 TaxID=1736525 RepID=UPI0009EC2963|nr:zinc ABC transporter ATP-binding protein AztA [Leifsonia sp. Root4]
MQTEWPSRAASDPAVMTLRAVSAGHGGSTALDEVSLELERGTVTVIAGANGSGKSTLLAVIAGLHGIRSGEIRRARGLRVAIVVQRSRLPERLPLTVRDAVRMGTWAGRGLWRRTTPSDADVVAQSIERVGLNGLEKRAVHSLSGGQMQRVLLAQGIAQRAELLLLDEPMNGVDEETSAQIRRLIDEEARGGRTVVHVSHDEQVIGAAERLIRLEEGRIRSV